MNPTKELIIYAEQFLDLIPERFKEKLIQENYSSAIISISHPIHLENKLLIESKKGIISIQYNDIIKTYPCNIFNYKRQIRKVCDDIFLLIRNENNEQTKPILKQNQCSLTFCEPETGIILEIGTLKRRIGWGDIYKVFESKEDAIEFANILMKDKDIECTLLNSEYEYIQTIRK